MQTVVSQISFDHGFIRLIFCILCHRKTLFFDFRKIMSGFSRVFRDFQDFFLP
jgi:hypothetical protein